MVKTSVYLTEALKRRIEQTARRRGVSEADVIRAALDGYTEPIVVRRPQLPLFSGPTITNIAERVDDVLAEGFGRD